MFSQILLTSVSQVQAFPVLGAKPKAFWCDGGPLWDTGAPGQDLRCLQTSEMVRINIGKQFSNSSHCVFSTVHFWALKMRQCRHL